MIWKCFSKLIKENDQLEMDFYIVCKLMSSWSRGSYISVYTLRVLQVTTLNFLMSVIWRIITFFYVTKFTIKNQIKATWAYQNRPRYLHVPASTALNIVHAGMCTYQPQQPWTYEHTSCLCTYFDPVSPPAPQRIASRIWKIRLTQ